MDLAVDGEEAEPVDSRIAPAIGGKGTEPADLSRVYARKHYPVSNTKMPPHDRASPWAFRQRVRARHGRAFAVESTPLGAADPLSAVLPPLKHMPDEIATLGCADVALAVLEPWIEAGI